MKIETVLKPGQCKTFLFSVQAGVTLGPKTLKECGFKWNNIEVTNGLGLC